MLSFSISYWDLIKFHSFAVTTERGDRVWKRGWLYRNFNVCKMNDGMSWQGAWESTMKHDNALNLSLSWCEILRELDRKTWFIYRSILQVQQSGLLGEKSGSKQYTWKKNRGPSSFANLNQLSFTCQLQIMDNFHAAHILHSILA
jgi:hypothetical protein